VRFSASSMRYPPRPFPVDLGMHANLTKDNATGALTWVFSLTKPWAGADNAPIVVA